MEVRNCFPFLIGVGSLVSSSDLLLFEQAARSIRNTTKYEVSPGPLVFITWMSPEEAASKALKMAVNTIIILNILFVLFLVAAVPIHLDLLYMKVGGLCDKRLHGFETLDR